jgi:hypothetical protein
MNRRYWTILCAAAWLALAVPAGAWEKPNLSGDWKLNVAKSDFGPMPGPEKMDRTIKHEDPSLKMTTTQSGPQGEVTTELAYTTDGKPCTNKIRGQDVTGVAKWDGDALTINYKREIQGMEITANERWTLSEDGKTLTVTNKLNTPQGDFEIKIVMDKQ